MIEQIQALVLLSVIAYLFYAIAIIIKNRNDR